MAMSMTVMLMIFVKMVMLIFVIMEIADDDIGDVGVGDVDACVLDNDRGDAGDYCDVSYADVVDCDADNDDGGGDGALPRRLSHALASRPCATTTTTSVSAMEEAAVVVEVSRFAARLFLVPLAPPGPLHLCVEMGPLCVLLPPSDSEVHDLDLTVPFTCLRSHHLLQVLTCLLLEQKLVLLSAEWALLAPVGHSLLAFLAPLCWRHTFVPVLASSMLGFLEAPTVYLMGTHGRHKHAISQVEDLVIVDLDSGQLVPTPASVPGYPPGSAGPPGTPDGQPLTPLIAPPEEAAEAFLSR
ncbi:MAP kinase-activating death domain protein-like [Lampetra fluviatilis]